MNIIGHQKIIKFFDKCVESKNVSHAYIFSGPENVGKFTFALELAKKILENVVIGDNLIIVQPEIEIDEKKGTSKKKDIIIDQVRDLQHSLSLTAGAGEHRIAIIDEADRMNNKAQNAFLKTLEESQEGVILIIIVRDEKNLLATISSRCQKIKFGLVADSDLLDNVSTEIRNKNELVFWSMGRPGLLLKFMKNESEFTFYKDSLKDLKGLFSQNVGERFALAETMAKDVDLSIRRMQLWILVLRSIILGRSLDFKIDRTRALRVVGEIYDIIKLLNKNNFNSRLLLENLFLNL